MNDHSAPTWDNQLWHARKLLREQGSAALYNPHAMIGKQCGCKQCFCCAALWVYHHQAPGEAGKAAAPFAGI